MIPVGATKSDRGPAMRSLLLLLSLLLCVSLSGVRAECPNACHGHGRCTAFDMCICYRNWMSADCSERVCPFGVAHADIPKGDLDGSGSLDGVDEVVIENHFVYPYGTTELFPAMRDSDDKTLPDAAHAYAECSSQGLCDRTTGECDCFEGFDGAACQRASCPGYPLDVCSGHGVCKSARQLARTDSLNEYSLWDKESTMGCECDAGYTGPDCSQRLCKLGIDPLFFDDIATPRVPVYDMALFTTASLSAYHNYSVSNNNYTEAQVAALFTDGDNTHRDTVFTNEPRDSRARWAVRFFDVFGEDWLTAPLRAGATCEELVSALESLPNRAVPQQSVRCTRIVFTEGVQNTFTDENAFYDADYSLLSLATEDEAKAVRLQYKLALWEAHSERDAQATMSFLPSSRSDTAVRLSGFLYRLKFTGNLGRAPEPEIELFLNGRRPSLLSVTPSVSAPPTLAPSLSPTLSPATSPSGSVSSPVSLAPSLTTEEAKVITKVWTDGQQSESEDFFPAHCDGVTVTVGSKKISSVEMGDTRVSYTDKYVSYLQGFSASEKERLKRCLGDADGDETNNPEDDVADWDRGDKFHPHVVRLVRTVSTPADGGYLAVIWYDTEHFWDDTQSEGTFRLLNPFRSPDNQTFTNRYEVYTTRGTLSLVSAHAQVAFGFASRFFFTVNTSYDVPGDSVFNGDLSCNENRHNADKWRFMERNLITGGPQCLEKGDFFVPLSFDYPFENPPYINLYQARRVFRDDFRHSVGEFFTSATGAEAQREMHYMTNVVVSDISSNWAAGVTTEAPAIDDMAPYEPLLAQFLMYKFTPSARSSYEYVAECSNRGKCDRDTGECRCFKGYTRDDCSEQTTLAS